MNRVMPDLEIEQMLFNKVQEKKTNTDCELIQLESSLEPFWSQISV